jgi:hypothetical protein
VFYAGVAAFMIVAAYCAGLNFQRYFDGIPDKPNTIFSFGPELTEAASLMDRQPPGTRVYFASDRWSINYETVRFLALDIEGEDRASQFSQRKDWQLERDQDALIVLIGSFARQADDIAALYPDATRITGPTINRRPAFVALAVPALAKP